MYNVQVKFILPPQPAGWEGIDRLISTSQVQLQIQIIETGIYRQDYKASQV